MQAHSTSEALFGKDIPEDPDIRIGSIAHTQHLDARRYKLGLYRIDQHMRPWRSGKLVVVGARSGHGKTALVEKVALANSERHKVLFASLEMPREELRDRMLAKLMRCSVEDVHRAVAEDDDDYFLAQSQLEERELLVWRPAAGRRSIQTIIKRAEKVSAEMLILDYTRMIDGWLPGQPATDIVNYLADWTSEAAVTTVLLTQLRDTAACRRPNDGDFQDTAQIYQRADHALLLWRPFLGHSRHDRLAEVIIPKNRGGPCFRAHAHWTGPNTDYHTMTDEEEAAALCCKRKRKED